jgi:nucleoside-diphosphate kinase
MSVDTCFIIIKPDALERCLMGRILSRLEDTYLRIEAMQQRRKNIEWARQHYAHLSDQPFFDDLAEFMTSRSIVGAYVYGPFSVRRLRKIVGDTNSCLALPGTIRGDWGSTPVMHNLIHCSDSEEAAEREAALFYDPSTDWKEEHQKFLDDMRDVEYKIGG